MKVNASLGTKRKRAKAACFSHISEIISDMPVRFAPGSVKLPTSFEYTGSPTRANTTGIDAVAFCAAVAAGVPEVQIRSTLALTSSRAYCSNLSMSLHSDPGNWRTTIPIVTSARKPHRTTSNIGLVTFGRKAGSATRPRCSRGAACRFQNGHCQLVICSGSMPNS
jgi:hypothetical protein